MSDAQLPNSAPLIGRLSSEKLSASGQTISQWVIANLDVSSRISLADLAKHCAVSQPSVVRWCKALGFEGYKDFQHWLARNLGQGTPYLHASVQASDSAWMVLNKVIDSTHAAVSAIRNQIDETSLTAAVKAIAKASTVTFFGQGNSGITAQDGAHKLFRIGIPSTAYQDPHIHCAAASMLKTQDVLILISNSGRTLELIDSARIAKQTGCTIIAITAANSPIAALADIVLPVHPSEDPDVYAPMTTRISQLVLLDALAVSVALLLGPELTHQLEHYKQLISHKRRPAKL